MLQEFIDQDVGESEAARRPETLQMRTRQIIRSALHEHPHRMRLEHADGRPGSKTTLTNTMFQGCSPSLLTFSCARGCVSSGSCTYWLLTLGSLHHEPGQEEQ